MITLILTMAIQVASNQPQQIPAHPGCDNRPNLTYHVESGIICIPSDNISKQGFESLRGDI